MVLPSSLLSVFEDPSVDSIRRRLPELLAGPWRFPPRPPGAGEEHKLSAREQESLDKKLEEIGIIGELREKSVKRFVEWAQKFNVEPDSLSQIVWWNKGKSLSQEEFERITDNQVQEMVHNEKKAAIQCFLNVIRLPEFEKDIREKFPGRQLAMKLMLLLEEYSARLSSCLDQNESELCVCIQLSILQCIAEWLWNRDPAEGGLLIFNRLLNFVHLNRFSFMQPSLFNSTNSDTSNLAKMLLNTWICASASIGFTKSTLNEDVFVDMPFDDLCAVQNTLTMVYQNDEILSNELFDPFSLAWEVFLQLAFSKSNRSISEMEQIRVWILSSVDEGRNARALGTLKKFLDQNKAAHISDKIYCLLYHYMSSEVYSELLEYADSSPFFDLIGLLHCVYSSSYQSCLHFWNVRFMVKETRSCPEFWLSLEQYNSGLEYISRNATAEEFLVFSEIRPFLSLISSLSVFKKSTQHLICFFNEHETLLPSIVRLSKLLRSDSLFGSDEAMLCVEYVLEFMNNVRIQVGEEECILLSESLIDFYYHWFSSIFSINIGRSKLSIEQIPLKFLSLCKNLDSNIELIADMKQDLLSLFVEKSLFISMEFERKTGMYALLSFMLEVLQKQSDKILRRYSPDILLSIFSKIFSNVFLSQETWKYSKSSSYLKIRTLTIQIFLNYLRFPFEKTGDSGIKIKNKVYLHFFDNESAIEIVMAPLIIGRIPGSLLTDRFDYSPEGVLLYSELATRVFDQVSNYDRSESFPMSNVAKSLGWFFKRHVSLPGISNSIKYFSTSNENTQVVKSLVHLMTTCLDVVITLISRKIMSPTFLVIRNIDIEVFLNLSDSASKRALLLKIIKLVLITIKMNSILGRALISYDEQENKPSPVLQYLKEVFSSKTRDFPSISIGFELLSALHALRPSFKSQTLYIESDPDFWRSFKSSLNENIDKKEMAMGVQFMASRLKEISEISPANQTQQDTQLLGFLEKFITEETIWTLFYSNSTSTLRQAESASSLLKLLLSSTCVSKSFQQTFCDRTSSFLLQLFQTQTMTMTKISQDLNLSERSSQLKHARFRLDCIDVWLQFAFHSKQDVRNSDTILRWIGDQLVQWVELWKRINRQVNGFHSIFSIVSSTLFSIALTSFSLRKDDGIMSLDSTIYNMFVGPLSFFILSSEFDSTSLSSSAFKTWSKFLLLENASIGSTDELEKVLLWANDYLSSKSVISSFDTLTDHVLQFLFSVATNRNHFDALIRSKHITTLAFFLKNILLSKDLNSHKDKYLKRKLILKILEMIASFTKWFVKGGLGTERVDSQVFSRQIKSFLMLHEEFLIPSLLLTDDTNSKWIDLTSFSARTCSAISRIILNIMDARFYLGSSWDEMLFKFLDAVRNSFVRISGLICDFDSFQFYARRLEPTGTTQLQSISLEPIEYSSRELIPFSSTKTYKTESGSRARISSTGSAITIWCIPEKLQDFSDKEKEDLELMKNISVDLLISIDNCLSILSIYTPLYTSGSVDKMNSLFCVESNSRSISHLTEFVEHLSKMLQLPMSQLMELGNLKKQLIHILEMSVFIVVEHFIFFMKYDSSEFVQEHIEYLCKGLLLWIEKCSESLESTVIDTLLPKIRGIQASLRPKIALPKIRTYKSL